MICFRCRADAVAGTVAGMPLCLTCIRQVKGKLAKKNGGAAFVGGPADENAGFFCDVPGPYSLGKKAGSSAANAASAAGSSAANAASDAASAVKDVTSTIKVLAIAGTCFGGAFLIYTMWRAHKMQERAVQFATEHPDLARTALLA